MANILYTSGCPRCNILVKKLDALKIPYKVFSNVDEMINMGITNVPILEVDGHKMNFKEAVDWLNERN